MRTPPDRPHASTGYFGMHAGGAKRTSSQSVPLPARAILIGGVRWDVTAEDYDAPAQTPSRRRPGPRGPVVAITCVRFATGRLLRMTYVTHPAADVMSWPDRELVTLFDVTMPAPAA